MIQEALALTLVCAGVTDRPSAETMSTSLQSGGEYASANTTFHSRARTNDRLTVEIIGDVVRIKGPPSLTPDVSGSGDNGWRTLTNVSITDREITGQISYNWFNRPAVRIDRMSGEIEMRNANLVVGRSSYSGECQRVERTAPLF